MNGTNAVPERPAGHGPTGPGLSGPGASRGGTPGLIAYVPVGWLAIVMVFALRGLIAFFPPPSTYGLPGSVVFLVYGGLAASAVTLLWGFYVLSLAIARSRRFRGHFAAWQIAQIAWLLIREANILLTPDIVFSVQGTATTAVFVAVGLFCLHLVRQNREVADLYDQPGTTRPPILVSAIAAILGIILGGAVGLGGGFVAGMVIAEVSGMSCFGGACGFFAIFVGLAGLVVGAIAGGIVAILLANRRRRPSTALN